MATRSVFISYSHNPLEIKEKIHRLADKLLSEGIPVVIDEYDLRIGNDIDMDEPLLRYKTMCKDLIPPPFMLPIVMIPDNKDIRIPVGLISKPKPRIACG